MCQVKLQVLELQRQTDGALAFKDQELSNEPALASPGRNENGNMWADKASQYLVN